MGAEQFDRCLTLDGSDFIGIWRSAVRAENGLKLDKNTVFCSGIWKMTFTRLLVSHLLNNLLNNLHKSTSQECKNLMGAEFWIFHFSAFFRPKKPCKNDDFCYFWNFETQIAKKVENKKCILLKWHFEGLKVFSLNSGQTTVFSVHCSLLWLR